MVISHDRWFLDRIATHILAFEGDSEVIWYEGNPCSPQELTALLKLRAEDLRDEPVHVSIHKSHPRRTFMPVIEAVSEAGLKMVLTGELEE